LRAVSRLFSNTFSQESDHADLADTGVVPGKQESARPSDEKALYDLVERFRAAKDPVEAQRLGDQLGRMIFGRAQRSATRDIRSRARCRL
jgi:hypothetical protein